MRPARVGVQTGKNRRPPVVILPRQTINVWGLDVASMEADITVAEIVARK